jgi:hypothetical protein
MLKKILFTLSILLISQLSAESSFDRANRVAAEAAKNLDCEFEDCTPKEPKVIIKEKIVIKEKKVPVFIIKERVVVKEKKVPIIIVKEKVVYKDRIVYKDRVVHPELVPAPAPVVNVASDRIYNKAFFDVHAKNQAPMLDYITFSKRASFDIKQFIDSVTKIKSNYTKAYIHGSIAIPDSIKTAQVYVDAGQKYHYSSYGWSKAIRYNKMKNRQDSDYFLVSAISDKNGHRYIDYKIKLDLKYARDLKESEENVAPNTFFFKIAPKVRGFKNKFIKTTVFITE